MDWGVRSPNHIFGGVEIGQIIQNKNVMIDDYFLYFVGAIVFLALACYVYAFGKRCKRFQKEHPEIIERLQHELLGEEEAEIMERQRHEREQRKILREAYGRIRREAFRKYPGIGGTYQKRRDYIKRKWQSMGN